MKQLSNDTVQLQHEIRLASKKVDVVGAIQSKVKDNVEFLRDTIVEYHSDVLKIDTESISEGKEQLFDKYKELEDKHKLVINQLERLVGKADDIDKSLSKSRQQVLDELDRQQVVATVQMDNLSASVADASQKLDDRIKHIDLSDIERGVIRVGDGAETFLSSVYESHKQMDEELAHVNASLDDLSNQQKTVDELNVLFHDTVKTLRETLKSIDDKVCQISPLYTGPSVKDIEESFHQIASTDIVHLMDELHDRYQQTTKEVVDTAPLNTSDNIDEAEPILVTLPDESPQELPIVEPNMNDDIKQPKKGFFARLFGGGDK